VKLLALVSDAFGGTGGIARYNRDLLSALVNGDAQRGIVVLPREGRAEPTRLPSDLCQRRPRGRVGFVLAALWTAWRDGPFDAVFCGHFRLAPLAAVIANFWRLPLWLQLHGLEVAGPLRWAQRWAVAQASLITSVSRHTRHRFLGLVRLDPWRLRVLPNMVGAGFVPGPQPEYLLDRHGLRGKTVLLTVARLSAIERYKGHDRVIAALPELAASNPRIVYMIVGEGEDRARLEDLTRTTGVADRVIFAGGVSDDELPDYYRAADLFVMPSSNEGFGIVFLEAVASGLPVIAGNIDGSADALADGALGTLINPLDRQELVRAVVEALAAATSDPALIERYRRPQFAALASALLIELISSAEPVHANSGPVGAG
jgi:phosphatidylinositol alpha-1,6-mannosyltransferase